MNNRDKEDLQVILVVVAAMVILIGIIVGALYHAESYNPNTYKYKYIGTFKYHNHSYIRFGTGSEASVVHDPDCSECLSMFD